MSDFDIPLWPVGSSAPKKTSDRWKIRECHLFPSGRAALTNSLLGYGFGREDLIWVPQFSSHCVLSAVGKVSRPTSAMGSSISAALVYEQWGWPFSKDARDDLVHLGKSTKIIIDSVDTPLTDMSASPAAGYDFHHVRVWSLGKTLGAIGGGLLTDDQSNFRRSTKKEAGRVEIDEDFLLRIGSVGLAPIDFFRQNSSHASREVIEMARTRVLESALKEEESNRRKNIQTIVSAGITQEWSPWMLSFLERGGAPGIAPLGIGRPDRDLKKAKHLLAEKLGVETSVYNFNSSGHPFKPRFDKCLAVPTHSQVKIEKMQDLVAEVSKTL